MLLLCKEPHSTACDFEHRSYKFHTVFGHSDAPFRRLNDFAHGPADVEFNGALKHLLWRKVRVELVKPRKHRLKQELDTRTLPHVLKFSRQRRLNCPTTLMSEHHEQLRLQVYACVLETSPDLRGRNIAGHTNDEEIAEFCVKNQFRGGP